MRPLLHRLLASTGAAVIALAAHGVHGQEADLAAQFAKPPASAKPRVWWHWMNGNITQEGIKKDLAWMDRVGIGGVQAFDAAFMTPQVVDQRLVFMTPAWRAAFKAAVDQARAQGMEFAIAGSPGWSESGGPWVQPQQAMKKLAWSATTVTGGAPLTIKLAAPPSTTGPFQNIPREEGVAEAAGLASAAAPELYRDIAVYAYRAPAPPRATVTSSQPIAVDKLADDDLAAMVDLPFAPGQDAWVQYDYGKPTTVHALTLVAKRTGGVAGFGATAPSGLVQASDDGATFKTLAQLPTDGAPEQTVAFAAITARYFRVLFAAKTNAQLPFGPPQPDPTSHPLAEVRFETEARVHRFEDKAGFAAPAGLEDAATPSVAAEDAIAKGQIIDLSAKLAADGTLTWTPPKGRWTVLRLGYSLTGRQNHPASPEGAGLEVDKLSAKHVRAYADTYLDLYQQAVGAAGLGQGGVQFMVSDSWEAGALNWTEDMVAEFTRRRGYDPRPWLPVLTGRVINSAQASDGFLFDFRKTLGEMTADNHYGELTKALHARGMGRYGESQEDGRVMIADGMQVKKTADVPMGALWATPPLFPGRPTNYDADIRESASVAHLYGQNLVAAESFTAAGNTFGFAPESLKPVADRMLAAGLNRFVLHTSAHQPLDTVGPGVTLGPFGQWFTRNETWAEEAGPWINYLARSSLLLQQGRFVADIAWYYGEDDNITSLYGKALPIVPAGYAYDFVNADALVNLLSVNKGDLVTPAGARFKVLVLDKAARRMSLPVLRKLRDLVAAGATIVGERPAMTPSLADDPAQFNQIADALWGAAPSGSGRVVANRDLPAVLEMLGIAPDVAGPASGLSYVHRALPDGDIYFVSNPSDHARSVNVSFRASGQAAEVWRADTAQIRPASYVASDGRTAVPLDLAAHDAVFVVFRGAAAPTMREVPSPVSSTVASLTGPWSVSFQAKRGAPAATEFPILASWTAQADPGIKYFSGTAVYRQTLKAPSDWRKDGARLTLDLGSVKNLARVTLNGRTVGTDWKAPFELDVTDALKSGDNLLEIAVTNLWPNRLIGDKQPGATKIANATYDDLGPDSPLLDSGLLGPVTIRRTVSPPSKAALPK